MTRNQRSSVLGRSSLVVGLRRSILSFRFFLLLGLGKPPTAQVFGRNTGHVRFDIENWRSIEHVNAADVQFGAFTTDQLNNGQSYRVGTARRSSRKHAVGASIEGWLPDQFKSLRAIEFPYDDEMRKAFDIGEAGRKLWQDFEYAIGVVFDAKTFGDFAGVFVGSGYEADWARGEHIE